MGKNGFLLAIVTGAMALVQCGKDNPTGVHDTAGHMEISGVLYNNDGSFSKNTKVTMRKKNHLADTSQAVLTKRTVADVSVATDEFGKFIFDADVEPDTYIIEAMSGNCAVFIDSVRIFREDSSVELPPGTLRPVGAIRGVVRLSHGGDPQKIYVLAFGIDRFTRVNADGSFLFVNLAEGVYTLRFLSSFPEYRSQDRRNIVVNTAETTDVGTIDLPYLEIPIPQNLIAEYDTMMQLVTLRWDQLDTNRIEGYNVYRRNIDSNQVFSGPYNAGLVCNKNCSHFPFSLNNGAIFKDDGRPYYFDTMAQQGLTYEYRVAAVDENGLGGESEGEKSNGVKITIGSRFTVDTVYNIPYGSADGQLRDIRDMAISPDGDVLIPETINGRIQVFDSLMQYKRQFGNGISSYSSGIRFVDGRIFVVSNSQSVLTFNAEGSCVDTFITAQDIVDIDECNGVVAILTGSSVSLYSIDGTLKSTWQCKTGYESYEAQYRCSRVCIAHANKLYIGMKNTSWGLNLIVSYDTLGNAMSKIDLSYYTDTDIFDFAFDRQNQRLFAAGKAPYAVNAWGSGTNGVLYVFDSNDSGIASYRIMNIIPESISIGLQKNGSLLIASSFLNENRIMKLKPLVR